MSFDTVLYILIGISSLVTVLLATGTIGILKHIFAPVFVCSPFVIGVILLINCNVIKY